MTEPAQLLEMKRVMEEEHQKDREALERLMRFLPKESNGSVPKAKMTSSGDSPLNANSMSDLTDIDIQVIDVMETQNDKEWTVREMIHGMKSAGFEVSASRPESTVNRSIRRLLAHGLIGCVREPIGRRAGLYRSKTQVKKEP